MAKILFYDLETTGLYWQMHGIWQIAAALYDNGEQVATLTAKMCPLASKRIEPEALKVGGITEEDLPTFAPQGMVFKELYKMLNLHVDRYNKHDKVFLCGFRNASFDDSFLRQWFKDNGEEYFGSYFWSNSLDVSVIASQMLIGVRPKMLDFKLVTVAKTLGIDVYESRLHDAEYDLGLTIKSYFELKERIDLPY